MLRKAGSMHCRRAGEKKRIKGVWKKDGVL